MGGERPVEPFLFRGRGDYGIKLKKTKGGGFTRLRGSLVEVH
jgi:hypothetical protein